MSELFLGVIAAAVVVMAGIQVAGIVFAARAARRIEQLAVRLEQDLHPVIANLQAMAADAARTTAVAASQVERADRLFADVAARIERTVAAVHEGLVAPAREGAAWLNGVKAILAALRDSRGGARRSAGVDDDDALFIG